VKRRALSFDSTGTLLQLASVGYLGDIFAPIEGWLTRVQQVLELEVQRPTWRTQSKFMPAKIARKKDTKGVGSLENDQGKGEGNTILSFSLGLATTKEKKIIANIGSQHEKR